MSKNFLPKNERDNQPIKLMNITAIKISMPEYQMADSDLGLIPLEVF